MIKEREANSWKSVSYAKSITGAQTYTKFPIVLRTTEQSIPTWNVKGNMVQSGTPTPTSAMTPSECGERTNNLCDGIIEQGSIDNAGNIPSDTRIRTKNYISLPELQCVISASGDVNKVLVFCYDENKNHESNTGWLNLPYTLSISSTTKYARLIFKKDIGGVDQNVSPTDVSNVMVNSGNTVKPYEPYGYKLPIVSGNTTTNIYLSEPLRKIGNYADTIAADGTVTRVIKKYEITGQEADWRSTGTKRMAVVIPNIPLANENNICVCTHYKGIYTTQYSEIGNGECTISRGRSEWAVYDSQYNDIDVYKAYVQQQYAAGTPVTVWYVLETPTTESTTTSAIPTTSGLNTIDVASTLKPSNMSLTYDGYKLCKGQRYTHLLHDNPLCGIDTYKDTLNLATGACTRAIKKLVLTGQENWSVSSGAMVYYVNDLVSDYLHEAKKVTVCSHYNTQVNTNSASNVLDNTLCFRNSSDRLYINSPTHTSITDFTTFLQQQYAAGTPVTVWYVLATPTTETIAVPTGLSGTEEGYLTQSGTPTPTNPVYPTANDVPVWE